VSGFGIQGVRPEFFFPKRGGKQKEKYKEGDNTEKKATKRR
jgi:hypothetical protein